MATKTLAKQLGKTKKKFEYIIKVDGKEVWRGENPTVEIFDQIIKENPGKEVGISVEPGEGLLIA